MTAVTRIRQTLRPLRKVARELKWRAVEKLQLLGPNGATGSVKWLVRREILYGGIVYNVPRKKVSDKDGRSSEELSFGGMTGGDRMLHHGYAPIYSEYLAPFIGRPNLSIMEVGILKGSGLAIWADLFPDADLLGLDIDPSHFENNKSELIRRGAFRHNSPEIYVFDQLQDGPDRMGEILGGRKIDIFIDDGLHSPDAIVTTLGAVRPYLANDFVAIIEDIGADALHSIEPFYIRKSAPLIHVLGLKG